MHTAVAVAARTAQVRFRDHPGDILTPSTFAWRIPFLGAALLRASLRAVIACGHVLIQMLMVTRKFALAPMLVFALMLAPDAEAQPHAATLVDSLEAALADHGFENVAAAVAGGGDVIVTYENRRYRYGIRGLKEAAAAAATLLPEGGRLMLIPQRRGIPIMVVTVLPGDVRAYARGEISAERFASSFIVSTDVENQWNALDGRPRRNASFARFDVVVHPQVAAQFGGRQDVFESQVNLEPEITTSLWKGMRISSQWIIPLQNELERGGDFVRPGVTVISQALRLPGSSFASLTAGYFTRNRYGVDAEGATYLGAGRWRLSARVGYTGNASFRRGTWTYTSPDVLTFRAGLDVFVPVYTTTFGVSFERFLLDDVGVRFDVERAFGEFRLGFFGIATTEGDNVGFRFVAPLFGLKYAAPARLRVRPARTFPWEYRYQGLTQAGMRYRTTTHAEALWEELPPRFIQQQLLDLEERR